MAESPEHLALMIKIIPMLQVFFEDREDVFACGNQFLYYQEDDSKKCTAPDIYVLKGVAKRAKRPSIKTWVEKTAPCFVLELTSKTTAEEDQLVKKPIYHSIGVLEYFLFDPLNEYLPQQFMGYRLIAGQYEPLIPSADGGLVSNQLQLRFVPDGQNLKVIDFRTGVPLKAPEEWRVIAELEKQNRWIAERQREEAPESREQDRQRRGHVRPVDRRRLLR